MNADRTVGTWRAASENLRSKIKIQKCKGYGNNYF